jgi:hypothetical protein
VNVTHAKKRKVVVKQELMFNALGWGREGERRRWGERKMKMKMKMKRERRRGGGGREGGGEGERAEGERGNGRQEEMPPPVKKNSSLS